MFFSFILFVIIGFIPFVAAYFALEINFHQTKQLLPSTLIHFALYSVFKLFANSVILAELQGHNIQTFIFTQVISSFEFVAFRWAFARNKVSKPEKGNAISFWWATLSSLTSFLGFISNSRTYELEPHHISYAISTIAYLFNTFAMQNFSLSIPNTVKISRFSAPQQLFVFILGVPGAITAIESNKLIPAYALDILKILTSSILWIISRIFKPVVRDNK